MRIALCFDIGGSKYNVGFIREDGVLLGQEKARWSRPLSAQTVEDELAAACGRLGERFPQIYPDVMGITIPGLADPQEGIWVDAPFSGIRNFPVRQKLEKRYGIPAAADNDGQACCLAESVFGSAVGERNFFYMTISNGIGGALFLDGKLYQGQGGAGEIGHCVAEPEGRLCPCGNKGCLEACAAGPGISQNYQELREDKSQPLLEAKEIARLARMGEEAALETFRMEGAYLGNALSWVINLLNVPLVILGGGVSLAFDLFEPSMKEALKERVFARANPSVEVRPTALGYNGGLYGAAALGFLRAGKKVNEG